MLLPYYILVLWCGYSDHGPRRNAQPYVIYPTNYNMTCRTRMGYGLRPRYIDVGHHLSWRDRTDWIARRG